MMATMVAELGMSTLPATCTGAVRRSQMTTKGACEKVKGLVVMASDGGSLLVCQRESQTVKDIHGPAAVTTAIAPGGLAQIVEQTHDGNAVSGVTALEVARGQEVVDNGFDAGALGRAEDLTDPVFGIRHVRHGFANLYSPNLDFLHRNHTRKVGFEQTMHMGLDLRHTEPIREDLSIATWPGHGSLYRR